MSRVFKAFKEILPAAQQRIWPELHRTSDLGLVLYGGTAIALRLGHRSSIDFDFFTERSLNREKLEACFPFLRRSVVIQDRPETLSVLAPSGSELNEHVRLSFFGTINFGRVGEPEATDDGVLQVASLDDLMATKLKVILQRIEAKDYRDIVAMVRAGISLEKGLSSCRAMYGSLFQPSESLKALTYFEGGDLITLSPEEKQELARAASSVRDLPDVGIRSRRLALARGAGD